LARRKSKSAVIPHVINESLNVSTVRQFLHVADMLLRLAKESLVKLLFSLSAGMLIKIFQAGGATPHSNFFHAGAIAEERG